MKRAGKDARKGLYVCFGLAGAVVLTLILGCPELGIPVPGGDGPDGDADQFALVTNVQGQGSVELTPAGGSYDDGTEVTLTPEPAENWLFVGWEGDVPEENRADDPLVLTIDGDKDVTAVFEEAETVFDFDDAEVVDEGDAVGVEFDEEAGGITLSDEQTTLPFIWVPNSNEGTISKVDTRTGAELGRYRVCPADIYSNPSRTTVDLQGNCYVGNRRTGTVVKVGLYESGGYVDRNGNGTIETSQDLDEDGNIAADEVLDWGADECVLWETVLVAADAGEYVPGTYEGVYFNDDWNPGTRSLAVDAENNIWVGAYGTWMFWYLDGATGEILESVDVSDVSHNPYGAVMDANGILWSSGQANNHVLRLDPSDNSYRAIPIGHFCYGLGVDQNNHLFVSGWQHSKLTRIDVSTPADAADADFIDWTVDGIYESRGVAVTDDGDVWTADSWPGTVTHWDNDGNILATINVGNTPTGVAVGADGYVWVVNFGDGYVKKIDPATDTIVLEKELTSGTQHYGYSDMTGIVARTISTRIGNWTVTYTAADTGVIWRALAWSGEEPAGTIIRVRVRSSVDNVVWSEWEDVTNREDLEAIPAGQYLQIEVTLQVMEGDAAPVVTSLAVLVGD